MRTIIRESILRKKILATFHIYPPIEKFLNVMQSSFKNILDTEPLAGIENWKFDLDQSFASNFNRILRILSIFLM